MINMPDESLDQLREQIVAAFAAARPSTLDDLANLPEPAEGEERHLELELQGQAWNEIDREFWLQHCWSFRSLLPASFRYYLSSLLLLSLDEPSDEWELVSAILSILTPGFRRLLEQDRDPRFDYQTSLLTPEQQAAICSFLGWLLTLPEWKYRSAKTLKFGWSQIDHPALQLCREFYDNLHHYAHSPLDDAEQQDLIDMIRTAFAERLYPGDDRLCGSEYGDEPAEYALEFSGLDWQTLHPEFLSYHHAALSFFTDEGFACFLPAFLITDVLGAGGNADPVFHLTHGLVEEPKVDLTALPSVVLEASGLEAEDLDWLQESVQQPSGIDWQAYALRRFAVFNLPERQAIVRYLEYRAAHTWDFVAVKINTALEAYWKLSLGQA
jgi:hypothetical protein